MFPVALKRFITSAYFALKCQHCHGFQYQPSYITFDNLDDIWLQQEMDKVHHNKVALLNSPKLDTKNHSARADLIKEHIQQICSIDEVPCAYLLHEVAIPMNLSYVLF